MENQDFLRDLLTGELSASLANTDYIVSMLNMRAATLSADDSPSSRIKMELLTEILQDIKMVMTPVASSEIH